MSNRSSIVQKELQFRRLEDPRRKLLADVFMEKLKDTSVNIWWLADIVLDTLEPESAP